MKHRGFLRYVAAGGAALGLAVATAQAETIMLDGGWQADVADGSAVGITVDTVGTDFIVIEIDKDFTDPPGIGGVFPAINIDFLQIDTDANTKPRIIIADESISNLTGVDWTDYHWALLNGGSVWFDATVPFDTSPFTNQVWSDPSNIFGDPAKATDLDVDGGVVPHLSNFFPGGGPGNGDLVIETDLSGAAPLSFTFKQFPTPEPTTAVMLGVLAMLGIRRRN